jgi:hypothetical protein
MYAHFTPEGAAMNPNASQSQRKSIDRERLNHLMDAVALIIARRQMKHYWAPNQNRPALSSIV